ncbi:MAG: hypothetical protein L0H63_00890 [Nitrococcus sp.]|nr:hypothetical protein [Nitrococcus sp.]
MPKDTGGATVKILEQGNIYFMYRPKVAKKAGAEDIEAEDSGDVGRFYMVLKPDGRTLYRLFVLGRKRMPNVREHERSWGFVAMVSDDPKELEQELQGHTYSTKTRGQRQQPTTRPAGEGSYAIAAIGNRRQAHLIYVLELPRDRGEVQKELGIKTEASFALSIKNPEKGQRTAGGLKEAQQADYPKPLQERFRNRRFDTEHPELLDYEGAEIILVGARTDPEEAYGLDLEPEQEDQGTADIIKDLRMVQSRHPIEPLFRGEWR